MLSVIIPSRNAANALSCLRAIRQHNPHDCRLYVIDDGLSNLDQIAIHYEQAAILPGQRPFIYARNCNIGIAMAGSDDCVLLNDDALLNTPGGFTAMQRASEEHPEYGIITATTNVTGYPDQQRRGLIGLRATDTAAFVCVLIPRRTIDLVGLLDERFIAYGGEDVDYCRRVRRAGLKVGVFDGCFVDHASLTSTFRGPRAGNTAPGNIAEGLRLLAEKWKDDPRP
jgi:GT2 family glycosyltransferase